MARTRAKRKPKADGESSTDNADNEEEPEDMEGEDSSDAEGSSPEGPEPKKAKLDSTDGADVQTEEHGVGEEPMPINGAPGTETVGTASDAHVEEEEPVKQEPLEPSQVQDAPHDEDVEVKEGIPPGDHTEGAPRDNVEDVEVKEGIPPGAHTEGAPRDNVEDVEEHDVNRNVDDVTQDTSSKSDEIVLPKNEDDILEDQVVIVGDLEIVETEDDVGDGNSQEEILQDEVVEDQDHPEDTPADDEAKDGDVIDAEGDVPHDAVKTEEVNHAVSVAEVADMKKVLPVYDGPSGEVVSMAILVNGVPFYEPVNRGGTGGKELLLERDRSPSPVADQPKLDGIPPPILFRVKQEQAVERNDDTVDLNGEGLQDEGVEGQKGVEGHDGDVDMQGEDESGDMADEAPLLLRAYTPQSEQAYNAVDNEDEMPPGELSYEGPVETGDSTYEDTVEPGELSYEGPVEVQNSIPVNDEPVPDAMDVSEPTLAFDDIDNPQLRLELEDTIRSFCSEGNQSAFNFTDVNVFGKAPEPVNGEGPQYHYCFSVKVVPDPQLSPLKEDIHRIPTIGNEVYPYLGNPQLGVHLSRRPDAVLPTGFLLGVTYRIYVFKVRVDKFETFDVLPTTDNSTRPLDPTCKIRLSVEKDHECDKPFERFLQSLIYISEVDDSNRPVEQPEVIRLYGVADFTVSEDCTVLYKGDVNLKSVGRVHVSVANVFDMDVKYMDLGDRPLMDFAILPFNAKVASLNELTSKSVFKLAITRVGGDFEHNSHIHIRHDTGTISDFIIKHTCFLSDDPQFPNLVKFLNSARNGAFNINASGFMPDLKNNDQCCVNFVFPNCNALGLLGIPCLPYDVLHCFQIYRLQVGPTLCPLRTTKHEKRLFALASSNLLARSDRISDNDIRVATAASFHRFGKTQDGPERFSDTEDDYNKIEATEVITDEVADIPEPSWDLPAQIVREAFQKGKDTGKSLLLNPAYATIAPKPSAMKRNNLVQNMARRVARRSGDEPPPPVLDMQVRKRRRRDRLYDHDENPTTSNIPQEGYDEGYLMRNPPMNRRIATAVIFEPAIFFDSQIPVELLHDVLTVTLTFEACSVMGNFSIILHQYLHQAFENANTDPNANMILYASSFSNYRDSDKLVVQERHYCDNNPPTFRTFLICAQATRQKRKLESIIVLSENASTVDHAIYERNKIKILTPSQYMAAMYAGDNTILMP
uniref:Midasin n=1 Tax=Panagrellus redivivus TaxID=6233 RepID=A0A7E4V2D7_PANRE